MSDIEISQELRKNPSYRIKSYTMFFVCLLLIFGTVFMIGTFGPDFFAFLVFIIIFLIPVLLLFKNKFIHILPSFIGDSLLDIDHENKPKRKIKFSVSQYTKEVGLYIMIGILLIGAGLLLNDGYKTIDQEEHIESLKKIMGSFVCVTIAGILILEMDDI